jgi:rsbT co-antagonist protein RsbR
LTPDTPDATDAALHQLLLSRADAILADWRARLKAVGGNYLLGMTPETEQTAEMSALLDGVLAVLGADHSRFETDPAHPLARSVTDAAQIRAARGYSPEESVQFLQAGKEALIAALHVDAPAALAATLRVERLLDRCVLLLVSSFIAARDDLARRQTESLREVSTPVITLWDSILLLPLVGIVDSVRAQQISERLLEAIARAEAEVTLIDVTGVPVMDTSVARHILKTVAAAEMLGTRVILTGISPVTAQTMVKLGIDLKAVPTRGSLKSGVALALAMTRRSITSAAA